MPFLQAGLRGQNFLQKLLVYSIIFCQKKYEGFRSSVVEHWSSNAKVMSSNPSLAKTWIYHNFNFLIRFLLILHYFSYLQNNLLLHANPSPQILCFQLYICKNIAIPVSELQQYSGHCSCLSPRRPGFKSRLRQTLIHIIFSPFPAFQFWSLKMHLSKRVYQVESNSLGCTFLSRFLSEMSIKALLIFQQGLYYSLVCRSKTTLTSF